MRCLHLGRAAAVLGVLAATAFGPAAAALADTVAGSAPNPPAVTISGPLAQSAAAVSVTSSQSGTANAVALGSVTAHLSGPSEWDTVACHVTVNGIQAGPDVFADLTTQVVATGSGGNNSFNTANAPLAQALLRPIGLVSGSWQNWAGGLVCSVSAGTDAVSLDNPSVQVLVTTSPAAQQWDTNSQGISLQGTWGHQTNGPQSGTFNPVFLNITQPSQLLVLGSLTARVTGNDQWDTAECDIGGSSTDFGINQDVDLSTQTVEDNPYAESWSHLHVAQRPLGLLALGTATPGNTETVINCAITHGSDTVYFQNPDLVIVALPNVSTFQTPGTSATALPAAPDVTVAATTLTVPADANGRNALPIVAFAGVTASVGGSNQWDSGACSLQYGQSSGSLSTTDLSSMTAIYSATNTLFGSYSTSARDTQIEREPVAPTLLIPPGSVTVGGPVMLRCRVARGGDSVTFTNPVIVAFTVGQAPQTIAFPALPRTTYGSGPIPLAAQASTGLPITYAVGVSDPCSIVPSGTAWQVAPTGAGTCTITASQAGDSLHAPASASQGLSIAKAPLTVTAEGASMAYGGSVPPLGATYAGFVNGDTASAISGTPACGLSIPASSPVGAHAGAIVCGPGSLGASNYAFTFQPGSLTITPAPLSITASNETAQAWSASPSIDPIFAGFRNGDTPGSLSVGPTCSTTATATSPGGTYPSTCSGAVDPNYTITYQVGTVTLVNWPAQVAGATPGAIQAGSGNTAVTISGWWYAPQASVQVRLPDGSTSTLQPAALSSGALKTESQISVTVPASLLAQPGTLALSVTNPAPGGGSFNVIPLYVTSRPTTVSSSQTVADSATLSLGAVKVTATGSGTVSLAQFASDPARTAPPHPADAFLGLFATPGNTYTDLSLVDCTPSSGQVLYWLDGAVWRQVSNQRFSNGCISVDLSATSSPSIQQLTGIYLGSQSTPKSDCGAAQSGTLNLHAANLDGCSLPGASLPGVDLRRATLLGTFLPQSNLAGANLAHATLEHADLVGANLSRASLQGANLADTDLSRSNLAGADLSGARLDQVTWSGTTCPDGTSSDADGGTCAGHLAP